jgi:predicted metal-binding membrane protein
MSNGMNTTQRRLTALTATLGVGAACWVVAVQRMRLNGMDMGVATSLGSFGFFIALWVSMMAAMMLPSAAPAVWKLAIAGSRVRAVPMFVGSYVAVWTLVGVLVYALYRPHGTFAAGAVVIAAGGYELTPLKKRFRRRCRESVGSGVEFGLNCVGSSIGLMLMLVALDVMSITWMSVIAVLAVAQKVLPANGRDRCAARASHRGARSTDPHRALVSPRTHATDVSPHVLGSTPTVVTTRRREQ